MPTPNKSNKRATIVFFITFIFPLTATNGDADINTELFKSRVSDHLVMRFTNFKVGAAANAIGKTVIHRWFQYPFTCFRRHLVGAALALFCNIIAHGKGEGKVNSILQSLVLIKPFSLFLYSSNALLSNILHKHHIQS